MKLIYIIIFEMIFLVDASAQLKTLSEADFLLAKKGKIQLGLFSGIPYIGIAEISYGFSNRVTAGLIYGNTPIVYGYGFRIKAVLVQPTDNFRLNFKLPFLYYPKTKGLGGDPWVLAWPTLNFEWKLANGARIWSGFGTVGAACADMIFGLESKLKKDMNKPVRMSDFWNTIQLGYSNSFSNRINYIVEMAPVLKGFKLANADSWVGGPPVILSFGISYSY